MSSKTIFVTGCTDGIGLDAVRQLVEKGHRVLMHGRNPTKLATIAKEIGVPTKDTYVADLSNMSQVYEMVNKIKATAIELDCLVNNAGVFKLSHTTSVTTTSCDGIDIRLAVNMVAPYIITKELLPLLVKGRVINVSSAAQAPLSLDQAFGGCYTDDFEAYAQSKLGLMMWTNAFAKEYPNPILMSLNPASMIGTKMVREGFGVAGKDIRIGSDILVATSVEESSGPHNFDSASSGKYFDNDRGSFGCPHPDCLNMKKNRALIDRMHQWLISKGFESN
eukprot:CAMPEP_0178935894 /NCGR_PEP_ID=MMETSP0786-20121207/24821_1 /TAXON_ID=186022 /ORGANISM="Thalassionema frauenfeldii, Strain CCMP 1798" /LENGTH=277 /DNA_ID=CAMNT_0020614137 /DNA_START=81 /DNA_END=914 /DNA_ORIENTATION=+